ncbi:MAG TPA: hypothetical protein PLF42_09375 [Anaerolineales bacterium]|nr:hypothetical protein [Anaerolineales bacterium]
MKANKISIAVAMIALLFANMACINQAEADSTSQLPNVIQPTQEIEAAEIPAQAEPPPPGECDNEYMPVRAGAAWNYRLTGAVTDTFTRSIVTVNENGFTEEDTFSNGAKREIRWRCQNGNLTALNPPSAISAGINEEGFWVSFETTERNGVTLPANIQIGSAWQQSMTIEGIQKIYDVEYQARNKITNDCNAIGIEAVTIDSITYEAMRVECKTVFDIALTIKDKPNQTTLTLLSIHWYARGIGLVKAATAAEGVSATVELVSHSIP